MSEPCKRHVWSDGLRRLPHEIRRGQQVANVESYKHCIVCGREKRICLLYIRPQSVATGQETR